MWNSKDKQQSGRHAEQTARDYLESRGLKWLESNFRSRGGEIDLIMKDGATLVFVEVRYRKGRQFGGAAASVNHTKQQRLIQAAMVYLQKQGKEYPCRFDVLALEGSKPTIEWITNAFQLTGI